MFSQNIVYCFGFVIFQNYPKPIGSPFLKLINGIIEDKENTFV